MNSQNSQLLSLSSHKRFDLTFLQNSFILPPKQFWVSLLLYYHFAEVAKHKTEHQNSRSNTRNTFVLLLKPQSLALLEHNQLYFYYIDLLPYV